MTIAIGYDYCLTFSKEITYIWKRPWTRVSTLFLLIRYVGYLSAFTSILFGTTFIPGPVKTCNIIYTLNNWLYALFWLGADMLMILRVYAIYNRSRTILHVLLTVYIAEVIAFIVATCIYSDPKYILVSIFQVLDITVCATVIETRSGINLYPIIQCIPSAILSIMVVAQSMKQSLQMYRVTRKWELNRYVALLVRDGVLYFFVYIVPAPPRIANSLDQCHDQRPPEWCAHHA
ncbi:hypothetical protein L210DRAFT_3574716 [Boletus edulis BED1]|uniref:DUF6533 domain-containing protein n=1 Tax=Boletus edulis BED1 TaxID=1328754 RepID=A0AAD4BDM4_BOLED|nr:hypothetical protein L210DRAFT_3574716 [Boletus edulis BED1]